MENLILVVDDAKFARVVAKRALQNGGYENIIEAKTAAEALELFQERQPDLTLLKKLLEINPKASIVMNSAIGQELIIKDAVKAGAKDFIIKPFEEKQFLETVNKALGV